MALQYGQIVSGTMAKTPSGYIAYSVTGFSPSLSKDQFVLGNEVGGNLYVMATLDTAWSLTGPNANNLLPYAKLNSSLQNASCCAVNKGVLNLEKAQTQCCTDKEKDIETMLDLISGISCIIPENEIIEGRQAVYVWGIEVLLNLAHTITVTIGTATYSFISSVTSDKTIVASEIAAYINTFYPQNYPYQAEAHGDNILVWGSNFDTDNGILVDATITNPINGFTFPTPKQLDFGTAKVLQGVNAITNNDVSIILSKLCTLCKN